MCKFYVFIYILCDSTVPYPSNCLPGFSNRQVEGLQGYLMWRNLFYQFPPKFVKYSWGPGARRFHRVMGGTESPILGPVLGTARSLAG